MAHAVHPNDPTEPRKIRWRTGKCRFFYDFSYGRISRFPHVPFKQSEYSLVPPLHDRCAIRTYRNDLGNVEAHVLHYRNYLRGRGWGGENCVGLVLCTTVWYYALRYVLRGENISGIMTLLYIVSASGFANSVRAKVKHLTLYVLVKTTTNTFSNEFICTLLA